MENVLCIGSTSKDIFLPTTEGVIINTPEDVLSLQKIAFEVGAKLYVEERIEEAGGCATNVSIGLARFGIRSSIMGVIGNDADGEWLKEIFTKERVDFKLLQTLHGRTDLSFILVDKDSGQRVIFVNRNVNEKLVIPELNGDRFSFVFVSSLCGCWDENLVKILSFVQENNLPLAYNPGQHNIKHGFAVVKSVIKHSEILLVNKDEAMEIVLAEFPDTSSDNIIDGEFLLRKLQSFGPHIVAITDGDNGASAIDKFGVIFSTKPLSGRIIVDTTGAGDAFSSAFIGSIISGLSVSTALSYGVINGSKVVSFFGAREGLQSRQSLEVLKRQDEEK